MLLITCALKGVFPFRDAHYIVGRLVLTAYTMTKVLDELTLDEYREFSEVSPAGCV